MLNGKNLKKYLIILYMNIFGRKAIQPINTILGNKMKEGLNTLGNKLVKTGVNKAFQHIENHVQKHYSPLEKR